MNQEEVHQKLTELYEFKKPFTVTFSGKKSKNINGLYKGLDNAIIIHNLNFIKDDGQINESSLMYTALHELAHHIQVTEHGQKGSRIHTKLFHSILDSLADKAESAGIYQPPIDKELNGLIKQVQGISIEIAALQRDLGRVLNKLNKACIEKGVRMEDMVKRKARISLESANKACTIAALDLPEGISADIQESIAGERDDVKRRAMALTAQSGKSVAQVKLAGTSSSPSNRKGENEFENLLLEKERLEKTIKTLQQRLKQVMEKINSDSGLKLPCVAERKNGAGIMPYKKHGVK